MILSIQKLGLFLLIHSIKITVSKQKPLIKSWLGSPNGGLSAQAFRETIGRKLYGERQTDGKDSNSVNNMFLFYRM